MSFDPHDPVFTLHRGGKLVVNSAVPLSTRDDLSLAYTPGVAEVCEAIAADEKLVYEYTWVRHTDYFKPPHFEKYPHLHELFNEATKLAGASGAKGSVDPAVGDKLLGKIEEISKIFWETKQA